MRVRDLVMLLAGLVVGVGGGSFLLGKARADGVAPAGERYQYQCVTGLEKRYWQPELVEKLNQLGAQGWHLMPPRLSLQGPGMYSDIYCFDRKY